MGAVGSAIGGVASIAGAAKNLLGGGGGKSTKTTIAPSTAEEQALYQQQQDFINKELAAQYGPQYDQQLMGQFRDLLTQSLSGGDATPEQIQQATSFVDETFTKPAQQQFDTFANDFMAKQAQRAAVSGRQVTDPALQAKALGTLAPMAAQIGAQRGQAIAQRSDELAFGRPIQQAGIAQGGLSFLSGLNQQAMANRLNLSNLMSNQQRILQGNRTGQTTVQESGAGMGAGLAGLGGAISGAAPAFQGLGGLFQPKSGQAAMTEFGGANAGNDFGGFKFS